MSRKTKEKRKSQGEPAGGRLRHSVTAFVCSHRMEIYICLGLIVATLLVFAQAAWFSFLDFDDDKNVYDNVAVRQGLTLAGVVWAFTTGHIDYWRPLTWLSHMADVQLYGLQAGGHHLSNVLLHMLNAILLFLVLRRMTGALWRSAAVAALFAIHPLRAESVAWVTERKDVLSGLFWWLTTWAYLAYAARPFSWRRYAWVVVLFMLALMAKPVVMTLPFFLLLLDYWPLKRLWGQSPVSLVDTGDCPHGTRVTISFLLIEKLPLVALSAVSALITFQMQRQIGTTGLAGVIPFSVRAANSVVASAAYLLDTIWPYPLAAIYPFRTAIPAWHVWGAAALLVSVTAFAIWKAARFPYVLVGWFWYLGVLLPVSGLVQMGFQSRADRFTYLPLVGIFLAAVWGLNDLMAGWRHRRRAAAILAAVILPALAIRAWSQVGYWHDGISLFGQNVAVTPENKWALNLLGRALTEAGQPDEAIPRFTEALRLDPSHFLEARDNLGIAQMERGRFEEALGNFSEAARLFPRDANSHYNCGVALTNLGRFQEALSEYAEALRLGLPPDLTVEARISLGLSLSKQGRTAEAMEQYSAALNIDPRSVMAHRNLAIALMKLKKFEEARNQLSIVLTLDPKDQEARDTLRQLTGGTQAR
jgi:Flp pilus assembly protein TadD